MAVTRKDRAAATRRRMMSAACHVFSTRGYAATTMDAVATEADVAVQTLYFTFHTKAQLLQAAYEYAVLGPEQTPPHLSQWWREVESADDVRTAVQRLVDGTLPILERAAPLVWTIRSDEDARATYEHNETLRRAGNEILVQRLVQKHSLRPGLSMAHACDILLAFTGPHQHELFIKEFHWPKEEFRDWVVHAILRELFDIT